MRAKIIICLIALVLFANFAFATELKLVKVSDLKTGDVVIDKNGNEIEVENIVVQEKESLSISEYLNQKVFGEDYTNIVQPGISGNVVQDVERNSFFENVWITIKGWFGR